MRVGQDIISHFLFLGILLVQMIIKQAICKFTFDSSIENQNNRYHLLLYYIYVLAVKKNVRQTQSKT